MRLIGMMMRANSSIFIDGSGNFLRGGSSMLRQSLDI